MIEHGATRGGRWLRERRMRVALWIAVIETVIVAFDESVSRWTVVAVAIPLVLLYLYAGRNLQSDTGRQVLWIAAASQALAVVAVAFAIIAGVFVLVLAAVFAAVALFLILSDRR
jgi:hypothetical protein